MSVSVEANERTEKEYLSHITRAHLCKFAAKKIPAQRARATTAWRGETWMRGEPICKWELLEVADALWPPTLPPHFISNCAFRRLFHAKSLNFDSCIQFVHSTLPPLAVYVCASVAPRTCVSTATLTRRQLHTPGSHKRECLVHFGKYSQSRTTSSGTGCTQAPLSAQSSKIDSNSEWILSIKLMGIKRVLCKCALFEWNWMARQEQSHQLKSTN